MIKKQSIQGGRIQLQENILIKQSPSVCYHFWRDFKNLPRFMDHVDSIEVIDKKRSHWIVEAPADTTIEWDAEILEDIPNQRLRWRSLKGSEVNNSGSVSFRSANHGRATDLQVTLTYNPPLGKLGDVLAELFGESPEQQLRDDLQGFKSLIEKQKPVLSGKEA